MRIKTKISLTHRLAAPLGNKHTIMYVCMAIKILHTMRNTPIGKYRIIRANLNPSGNLKT
jgi:hypothetical protein